MTNSYEIAPAPKRSATAVLSIIAALGSYYLSYSGHGVWALLAAIIGVCAGVLGLIMSASPRFKGGALSFTAIVLSVIAIVPALLVIFRTIARHV